MTFCIESLDILILQFFSPQTTVYKIVLMNGGAVEYNRVLKSYNDTEDNQERKYAMFSLGSTNVESLRTKTLDWAVKSGDIKLQDIFYPIGSVASNVTGSELAWAYYKEVSNSLYVLGLLMEIDALFHVFHRILLSSKKS